MVSPMARHQGAEIWANFTAALTPLPVYAKEKFSLARIQHAVPFVKAISYKPLAAVQAMSLLDFKDIFSHNLIRISRDMGLREFRGDMCQRIRFWEIW